MRTAGICGKTNIPPAKDRRGRQDAPRTVRLTDGARLPSWRKGRVCAGDDRQRMVDGLVPHFPRKSETLPAPRGRLSRQSQRSSRPRSSGFAGRPRLPLRWDFNRKLVPCDVRVGVLKWRCGGISPFFRERITLITPATPAAASKCPMLVFTDPTRRDYCVVITEHASQRAHFNGVAQ